MRRQGLLKVICHVRPLGRKAAPSQQNEGWTGDQRPSNERKAIERLEGLRDHDTEIHMHC